MKDLAQIAKSITLQTVKKGDFVFKQNDHCDNFYFIIKGAVGLYRESLVQVKKETIAERKEEYNNVDKRLMAVLEQLELLKE